MFKKVALTLFLLITAAVIAILAIAGTRPATYHVERSAQLSASPEVVFGLINDFNRFPEWSPWQDIDPKVVTKVEGGGVGVGATYYWVGNNDVGEGRMTITESTPSSHVAEKLEFLKPFAATCEVHFRIVPQADGSHVTWAMDGTNNYMAKVMSLFMNMDSMIGKDFEKGLGRLKSLAEGAPAPAAAASDSSTADSSAAAK
ncbi:MAG: SRPBCC family protein [Candidatus Eisenbacteria bacterium]